MLPRELKLEAAMRLSVIRTGLVFGVAIGLWHAAWSALVAAGCAQWLVDFILRLHFLAVPAKVQPFDTVTAGTLIGITFVVGFVFGIAFALIWNVLHPRTEAA